MERRNRKQKENKDRSIGDDARIAGLPGGMDNARIKEREEWITKANAGERMDNIGRKNGAQARWEQKIEEQNTRNRIHFFMLESFFFWNI